MKFLNKLSGKNLVKEVLCGVIAAGCVFSVANNASAEGWISADAKKIPVKKGYSIWVAGKDKISVIDSQKTGYKKYDGNIVYGGFELSGITVISGKTVEIKGVSVEQDVAGGFGNNAKIEKNTVIINNAKIDGDVCGGQSYEGAALSNNVKLTNTAVEQDIYGGFSEDKVAKGNKLTVVGGSVAGSVYGASSDVNANGNSVSIKGSKLGSPVYGGYSELGHATDNNVTLTDVTFNILGTVYGGCTKNVADGQNPENKIVKTDNNTVTIKFTKKNDTINSVYGGYGTNSAQNNKVFVTSNGYGKISSIVGGSVRNNGIASNNLVVLENIVADNVTGGESVSLESKASTNNNIVVVADSKINVDVHAGNGAVSKDNTVVLVGKGGLYNLTSQDGKYKAVVSGNKKTTIGNEVSGGRSGNTLAVYGNDTIVGNIRDFQKLKFTLKTGDNKGINMLTIKSESNADTVLKNVTSITVTADPGANLAKDAKVNLIHKTDSGALKILAGANDSTSVFDKNGKVKADYAKIVVVSSPLQATSGELSMDKLDSDKKMNDLVFTAKENISVGTNGELGNNVKSVVETRANAAALLNEAADFFLEQGLVQAKATAKASANNGRAEIAPFAAVGGSNMRYKTGSHIDSNSWHGAMGISKQAGDLTYGVAVEHGKSNYDSYVGDAHGEGKSQATGGVVFAENKRNSGVHYDAAFRAGRIKNDYMAHLSLMGVGANVSYKDSSAYYGLSLGVGKEFKLTDKDAVDFYGRYYWSHTNSADITTNLGDEINFDAVNSHRARLGTRYTHAVNDMSKLYAGLAWQYEFSGETRATVNGDSAPAPSLKGHSGMLELGWKVEAAKNMSVDLNVNGWTGKQKGVAGGVNMQWKF